MRHSHQGVVAKALLQGRLSCTARKHLRIGDEVVYAADDGPLQHLVVQLQPVQLRRQALGAAGHGAMQQRRC